MKTFISLFIKIINCILTLKTKPLLDFLYNAFAKTGSVFVSYVCEAKQHCNHWCF